MKTYKGHIAMLAANVIWGLMAPIAKTALDPANGISALTLTGMRIIGAAALFWIGSLLLPRSLAPKETVERKDWKHIIAASMLITFANQMCVIFGVSLTSPIEATVMCCTTPFFTLVLVAVLWKIKHHWAKILGVCIGFAGILVYCLFSTTNAALNVTNPLLGDLFILMAQVFGAVYMVCYVFLTKKYHPFTLMKWMFTCSALVMLVVSGPSFVQTTWSAIPLGTLLEAGYVVVFGTFIAYVFLPIGQRYLMPTQVAMYNYLQPVITAVFSIAIGVATIAWSTVVGAALIFLGVALVNRKS